MAYKYTKERLEPIVARNFSVAGVMRELGFTILLGGSHSHISRTIKKLGLDTSHFTGQGHNRGKASNRKKTPEQVFVVRSNPRKEAACVLRRALLEYGVTHACNACRQGPEFRGRDLILEINHINGNCLDNRRENLEFLCPNCHSQTETYGARNRRRDNPKTPKPRNKNPEK